MEEKLYIGIDVGAKGYIVTLRNGEFSAYSILDNDLYSLSDIMAKLRSENDNIACVIEDVRQIFGSSSKATFDFGVNKGVLLGLLCANKIPYTLVQPKTWQKAIWSNADMVYTYKKSLRKGKEVMAKRVDTKATSINAAKRLFPTIDFRRTERCKNIDDNMCDATLMCEYARRKNL